MLFLRLYPTLRWALALAAPLLLFAKLGQSAALVGTRAETRAETLEKAPERRLTTLSGLGFSVDRKPGVNQPLAGSFVLLGVGMDVAPRLTAGLLTVADGGKSARFDNYRLATLASFGYRLDSIFDTVHLAAGPYTETLISNSSGGSWSSGVMRQRGVMALLRLTRPLYRSRRLTVAAESLLGAYGPSSLRSTFSGISLTATFSLM